MITDDAAVVGLGAFQTETWLRLDPDTFEHWLTIAYGPLEVLELSAGVVHGTELADPVYALRGPLVQLKLLLVEPEPGGMPGAALATGAVAPWGFGGFEADAFSAYAYAAGTLIPGAEETLVIDFNLGVARARLDREGNTTPIWGAGAMVFLAGPLFVFAELVSGDPDTREQDGLLHGGVKYQVTETAHFDASFGAGIWGEDKVPRFATLGFRWATQ